MYVNYSMKRYFQWRTIFTSIYCVFQPFLRYLVLSASLCFLLIFHYSSSVFLYIFLRSWTTNQVMHITSWLFTPSPTGPFLSCITLVWVPISYDSLMPDPAEIWHAPSVFPEPVTCASSLCSTWDLNVLTDPNGEFDYRQNHDSAVITPPPISIQDYMSLYEAPSDVFCFFLMWDDGEHLCIRDCLDSYEVRTLELGCGVGILWVTLVPSSPVARRRVLTHHLFVVKRR